jgi:asparagine synthase (glutamine-hydrolysing)
MCGIAGAYWSGNKPVEAKQAIEGMMYAMRHRGPDSDGRASSRFVDVGFQRLSIIDLTTGDQPVRNEDGSIECFLNGEIYNYQALRKGLMKRGHVLHTTSDTEVLPHLYEELGQGMFCKLNGMFSICLIDHRSQTVLLARDHFGVKQMYYARTSHGVVFGSEVKAVLASGLLEPEIDEASLLAYLALFYSPQPHTLLKGVKKLPPGCLLKMGTGAQVELVRYYELPLHPPSATISADQATKRFLDLFTESVRLQLHADVPVGISLSGGIDSSAIVCAASRCRGSTDGLTAITISWPDTVSEEVACAKELCQKLGMAHEVVEPATEKDVDLPLLAWISDEPIADPATYSQFLVGEAARQRVKVLLGGAGGDELFAGYGHHALSWKKSAYSMLPAGVQQFLYARAVHRWMDEDSAEALKKYSRSPLLWHCKAMSNFGLKEQAYLCAALKGARQPFENFCEVYDKYRKYDVVNQQLLLDLHCYLADQILPMMDRSLMAASVEGRVPFLDVPLVEFCFTLSGSAKVGWPPGQKRWMKRALAKWLPPRILRRKKAGMPSHFSSFIAKRPEVVRQVLLGAESYTRKVFPAGWIQGLVGDDVQVRRNYRLLYALVLLEVWHALFVQARIYHKPAIPLADLCRISRKKMIAST